MVPAGRVANIALNVFLIVAGTLTCADIVQRYATSKRVAARGDATRQAAQVPSPGSPVSVPGVEWNKTGRPTLVFGISTGCHFCSASAPFYKRLLTKTGAGLSMMAVAPEPVDQTRLYLNRLGIPISNVRQAALADVGIRGTPTLVVVDRSGRVIKSWRGFLTPERERQVLDFTSAIPGQ
jgi:hypothetical protein